jgi:FAD/FMN-containing dehydrogenase
MQDRTRVLSGISIIPGLDGEITRRGDPDYERVRAAMVWNALKPERRPDLIVRVRNEHDVVKAIGFARSQGLKVAIRGGGHSWCGLPLREGGMLIDLSDLTAVAVDPGSRTAAIEPCVANCDLIEQLKPHGLAFPVGHCPSVKASGFLLSGGIGWNAGCWGPACQSVTAIDMVTAEGRLIRASATEHQDLFWAARGGGPGTVAVATRYYLKLHDLPRSILSSTYYCDLGQLREALEGLTELLPRLPRFVEISIFLMSAPRELAPQCASSGGKLCMVSATAFGDTEAEAAAALGALETCSALRDCLAKSIAVATPFRTLFDISGRMWPENHRYLADVLWSSSPPAEILLSLSEHFVQTPSAKTVVLFALYPGWAGGAPDFDAAFSKVGRAYGGPWTIWQHDADDAANHTWHRQAVALLQPFTEGHYIGETDIAQAPSRVPGCFAPSHWRRLQELRAKHDPDQLFQGFFGGIG